MQWKLGERGAYTPTELFWYCLERVPAVDAHRCIPALVSGELPPEVPPPPDMPILPPSVVEPSKPNIWKWVAIGAVVYSILKR